MYESDVYTSNKDIDEKYIANGWYEYAKEKKLRRGGKLGFTTPYGPERLYVKMLNH